MTIALSITVFLTGICFCLPVYDAAILPRWVVFCAGTGICCVVAAIQRRQAKTFSVSAIAGAFLAWTCIQAAFTNTDPAMFEVVGIGAIVAVLIVDHTLDAKEFRAVLRVACWTGGCLSAVAILQHIGIITGIFQQVPPAATFLNRNILAEYLVGIIPVAFWICWEEDDAPYGVLGVLMCVALALTECRGALAGLFAGTVLVLYIQARTWKEYVTVATFFALFVFLLAWGIEKPPQAIYARLAMWENTLHMIRDHAIWGVGPTRWRAVYPLYGGPQPFPGVWSPHCDALQICAEYGVPGFLLALSVVIVAIVKVYRYSAILCVSLLAVLGASCFGFTRENAAAMIVPVLVTGYACRFGAKESEAPMGRWGWSLPATACFIGAIMAALFCCHDVFYLRAWKAAARGDWETSLAATYQAQAYGKWRPEVDTLRGKIHEWIDNEIKRIRERREP